MNHVTPPSGEGRVIIQAVAPAVDGYPVKRTVGERVVVSADIFADGHDVVAASLFFRREAETDFTEVPMHRKTGDRFEGAFDAAALGAYRFFIEAWIDAYQTWRRDTSQKLDAGLDVTLEAQMGASLVRRAAANAEGTARAALEGCARELEDGDMSLVALVDGLDDTMRRCALRPRVTRYDREVQVIVEPELARFSSWYEIFPRSASPVPGRHGTFADVAARLDDIAEMGFDVLYLPPIHPIGTTHRKGKNNTRQAHPGDVGSPWAIGSREGGHKAVHPELGTLDDFDRLVRAAADRGIRIALDIAFQCSPDHPYVREHPEWFKKRPDGSIQYAENPPKKYEDIYPFDFACDDWRGLYAELYDVVRFWIAHGVTVFRVDNPHTKPFHFWRWLIAEVRREHPEVVMLSEAFARPLVMYELAKVGFSLSYDYFPWKNSAFELEQYFGEITRPPISDYFRPSSWTNTPDILNAYLQDGGRPAFVIRLVLAATLSSSYGIYGPAFELCEGRPREPGSEEYLDSEKYELRHWDLDQPHSLRPLVQRINSIRRASLALQFDHGLVFHQSDVDPIIAYSKRAVDGESAVLVVVNLDPYHRHGAFIDLSLEALGIDPDEAYQAHDLLGGARFSWRGSRVFVELDPFELPAHIFQIRRSVRSERDFEYFM